MLAVDQVMSRKSHCLQRQCNTFQSFNLSLSQRLETSSIMSLSRYTMPVGITSWTYFVVALIFAISFAVYVHISNSYRRSRLGSRAVIVPYRLPFGWWIASYDEGKK